MHRKPLMSAPIICPHLPFSSLIRSRSVLSQLRPIHERTSKLPSSPNFCTFLSAIIVKYRKKLQYLRILMLDILYPQQLHSSAFKIELPWIQLNQIKMQHTFISKINKLIQQPMDKLAQLQQTKGTEMSFPMLLNSLKERESESEKTLFKNDSLSSDQAAQIPTLPKKLNNASNLPQLDQIKKFLKRGEQINNETLKRLKEDKQINELVKPDRSSASLYKTSRHLDFISIDNPKEKEIKRIYMGHKKTKSRPLFIFPIYRGKKMSQEVQTDAVQPALMIGSRKNLAVQSNQTARYPSFEHHLSYNTIEAISQQFSSKQQKKHETYLQVEEDAQEEKLLPNKEKRNAVARAKAVSSKHNIEGYMKSMGKTSFDFYNGMNKINNRYKEYREQETIYSKTIDMKPLLPLKETLNTFTEPESKVVQQPTKVKKQEESNGKPAVQQGPKEVEQKEKADQKKLENSTLIKIEKVQSKLSEMQKKIESFKESMMTQQTPIPLTFDKDDKEFEHQSSMIPQESENVSPYPSSRSRQVPSRISQNLLNLIPSSPSERKRPNNMSNNEKTSILIQVPSMHELKVGQIEATTNQINHPIRQHFNQNEMNWVKNQYHPKHQIFRGVNLLDFQIKKYKNGVFFGEIDEEGHKHGKGIIFYYSGKIYEGELNKDMKQGKGLQIYPDGSRFKGEFASGLKQGRGIFEWSNGEIYDGQWENGRKNGSGMWKGTDCQSYIGQWKNGKVEGFGVYVMKNGSRYEGQFKNSLKHGVGTQRFYNGETYVGNYQKNRPNGEGEYYWANGDYYKGLFSNGLRHGEGYFKEMKTGIEYRGEYKNDKKCGYGEINYQNGLLYVGNFENNFRHGFGELTENGGLKYRGYWINDHQVDEMQEAVNINLKKQETRNKKKESRSIPPIHTIKEDELERNESLPRPIVNHRNQTHNPTHHQTHNHTQNQPHNHTQNQTQNHTQHSHHHHHHHASIDGDEQGYKRPCGCNKKH